ncbi:hypothetical protein ElyMa_003737800 [Elysia marginata]|uniref:Reverse transcriptase domain-containing protein n=1 Tax=Elysia marginata TaxID=1093978 RepID=A0AAV4F5L2_9GAST|nr:hypothetical protein ElyMa_003737800 [Elysia marginata]
MGYHFKAKYVKRSVNLIHLFHGGMNGLAVSGGEASEPLYTTTGVKQGCVLAPVPFNFFFTCILNHSVKDLEQKEYMYLK